MPRWFEIARPPDWRNWLLELGSGLGLCAMVNALLQWHSARGKPLVFAMVLVFSLWAWVFRLRKYRTLIDWPVSRVASAAQGYVKLEGSAQPVEGWDLLYSPASGRPCLWYRWESYTREDGERGWTRDDEEESHRSFWLDDGTGRCLIDPSALEVQPSPARCVVRNDGDHRVKEWTILPGDGVHVMGAFVTRHAAAELDARADTAALLENWKADQPALLRRFDLDGDGSINQREWELARSAARREVERMHTSVRDAAAQAHYLHAEPGRLNLLSTREWRDMARLYAWQAALHLALFFVALAGLVWLLRH